MNCIITCKAKELSFAVNMMVNNFNENYLGLSACKTTNYNSKYLTI